MRCIWKLPVLGLGAVLTLAALSVSPVWSQDEEKEKVLEIGKWYPGLEGGLNLTQSSYSDNWAGGDEGSIVWASILNGSLENQFHEKLNWDNQLKLAYGQTHQQSTDGTGARDWDRPEKSTDLIDYETIFRFTLGYYVDPYLSGRFESQFQDASDPWGRTLAINPMKFKESAGFARQFIDEEDRSLLSRFGFTLRQTSRRTFVDNPALDAGPAVGDETQTKSSLDGGLEWVTDYKTKVLEDRVTWTSKLSVYQPFFYSKQDDIDDNIQQLIDAGIAPDVGDFTTVADLDFENIFSTQITKVISVGLYARWVYDKFDNSVPPELDDAGTVTNIEDLRSAIRKSGQFKQTMTIGLTYRFL